MTVLQLVPRRALLRFGAGEDVPVARSWLGFFARQAIDVCATEEAMTAAELACDLAISLSEVDELLDGLEALGLVVCGGGVWRLTAAGSAIARPLTGETGGGG